MLSNRSVIATSVNASPVGDLGIRQPEVLTPEVMVFFAFLAFLAVFGFRRGGHS